MSSWKTDPLYRLIFDQVQSLRERLGEAEDLGACPPDGFRIEEHHQLGWDRETDRSTLRAVWILDDHGVRLFPGLRNFDHDPGVERSGFWQFGLVRFSVAEDRSQLVIRIQLGPDRVEHHSFEVCGSGHSLDLIPEAGSLSGTH